MPFGGDWAADELKIVAEPHQVRLSAWMAQETIVKSLAKTDAVTARVEGHARHHDQVRLFGRMILPGGAGFKYAETSMVQAFQPLYLAKHHLMAADRGI